MFRNRFILPAPSQPIPDREAFMGIPMGALPPLSPSQIDAARELYRWAWEQAQAVVRPSLPERDLLGVWN
ncbi:MAG: hypothetical protein ACKO23_18215 [Gemmataceae bacterium]